MDFSHLSDSELIEAYVEDALPRSVGVDYFLAQEVNQRGLTDEATAAFMEAAGV